MKIDHDDLKRLLEAFEARQRQSWTSSNFKKRASSKEYYEGLLVFHMRILTDQGSWKGKMRNRKN